MRDHTKLRAFELADALALMLYLHTRSFPRDEQFGLTSQLRRAAVSIASNIVEGSARGSETEYLRFLDMVSSSSRELQYQLSLARRLEYLPPEGAQELESTATETAKVLNGPIRARRKPD